jgi:phosphoribosylformimino-5-aminoimidazole carboxamide ribotide isomerase
MTVTSGFKILVAIDLRGGRVVRLEQGDFGRETAFADDPAAVATAFVDAGARWLHVVDLDGARSGAPAHGDTIAAIVAEVGDCGSIEVAGGLRTEGGVAAVLATGAARAVVGTAALADPAFAGRLVMTHGPSSIAAASAVRAGRALGHGWDPDSHGVDAAEAIASLADAGVETFEVTAIDRDGLLAGPDLALYERIVAMSRGAVIASGGIASIDDLRALRDAGCSGAIVGRALYTGRLDLAEVLAFATGSA